MTGFEKDLLAGKILSHLYPDDKVRIEGYEKMEGRYSQHFDVIASNSMDAPSYKSSILSAF